MIRSRQRGPFPLVCSFFFFFWYLDRTIPSHHHHPFPLPLSISPFIPPIGSCIRETCWRFWVARASNGLSLSFVSTAFPFQWASRSSTAMMFGGYRIWGLLLAQDSIDYPIFGIDLSKLFFLRSPYPPESHGISCHGQFDSTF